MAKLVILFFFLSNQLVCDKQCSTVQWHGWGSKALLLCKMYEWNATKAVVLSSTLHCWWSLVSCVVFPNFVKKMKAIVTSVWAKVEKIQEDSLDSIPSSSPSVKIEIIGGKVYLRKFQKFVNNAQQCFAFTPQTNFPAHILNFHWRWRWWDWIQATF